MHDRNSRLRTGIFVGVAIALGLGAAASQTGPQPPVMPPIDVFPEKFGVSIEVTPGNAGNPQPLQFKFDVSVQSPGDVQVVAEFATPSGGLVAIPLSVSTQPKTVPHAVSVTASGTVVPAALGEGYFPGKLLVRYGNGSSVFLPADLSIKFQVSPPPPPPHNLSGEYKAAPPPDETVTDLFATAGPQGAVFKVSFYNSNVSTLGFTALTDTAAGFQPGALIPLGPNEAWGIRISSPVVAFGKWVIEIESGDLAAVHAEIVHLGAGGVVAASSVAVREE